jgi:lysophospholipase L1-like esterase
MNLRFRILSAASFALLLVFPPLTPANSVRAAEAQWIWSSAEANKSAPPSTSYFSKTFELGEPASGLIEITCDNRYVMRLNGRLVGASNNWQQMDRYEVTPLLVAGENTLDIRCVNDGDAAGLAVRVTVQAKGAEPVTHSTDESWLTRLNVGQSWNPAALADVKPVKTFVLGELGKTAPWAASYKLGPIVERAQPSDDLTKPFELLDGDRVVLLGNTFIEREQSYGYLETALTAYWPDRNITFRNLGWSGDTVTGIARARFGSVAEGFRHLTEHVYAVKPTVIFVGYGANESFAGPAGLDTFTANLTKLLEVLQATGARIVFLSPLRQENLGPPLPDPTAQNKNIALYATEIRDVAAAHGCRYVDLDAALFGTSATQLSTAEETPVAAHPLTDNGVHLTAAGYRQASAALLQALSLPTKNSAASELSVKQLEALRQAIVQKNQLYFYRWRPQNETYLYLFRKHEQGQNAREIPEFDPLVEELEAKIARLRKPVE